ncbi:MAG: response regulator [Candidatus Omnitrophica bacterium]|nr:response regulator [Candidatus Omnitrophota bacterium]
MEEKKKILIVDDEVDLIRILKAHLEKQGYEVYAAYDGQQGLDAVNAQHPDLVILDMILPVMSGIELYEKITTSYGKTKVPVLVLTARDELGSLFKEIDADGFLAKPFETNDLLVEIKKILDRKKDPVIFLIDIIKDRPNLQELKRFLNEERFRVVVLENLAALEVTLSKDKPDFILMEYMQKDFSGEDVISRIKSIPELESTPLLVYSYSGFEGLGAKSLNSGADTYIGKPDKFEEIVALLRDLQLKMKKEKGTG